MLSILRCCTNRITLPLRMKITSRKYMTVSEKMELLLKQKDHISRDYKLIYRDKNHTYIGLSYHTLNLMSWTTVTILGYLWYNDIPVQDDSNQFTLSKNPFETFSLIVGTCSIFLITIWLRQRYVLRIYFNEVGQTYRAIFVGRMPFMCEFRDFPAKSLTFASKDSVFPWRNTVFKTNNRKIYLFDDNFRTHHDFLKMLKPGEV